MSKVKVVLLSGAVIIMIVIGGIVHLYWLDGICGALLELTIGETVYSKDYSECNFKLVRNGMTEQEVINILGGPLFKYNSPVDESVMWFYSYGKQKGKSIYDTDSNYTQRIIEFQSGKVVEVHHGFYLD